MALEISWNLGVWGAKGDKTPVNRAITRAMAKAGGDAARAMRVEGSKGVRSKKRLKVARVKKGLPVTFPRNKTDIHALVWRMDVSGEPVRVGDLTPRQTKKGVTFGINKGKRSLIRGAFIATLKSGHKGVFRRRGESRLPIDEAFTTRISDVFRDGGFIPGIHKRTMGVFKSSFARLLPLEIGKVA